MGPQDWALDKCESMNYGNIMYFKVTTEKQSEYFKVTTEKQSEYQDTKISKKEGSTAAIREEIIKEVSTLYKKIRSLRELKTYMPFQKNR